jgi:uncharacterized protein
MELLTVKIEKADEINLILGQSHFIKTVEDLHEALVTCVGGIEFGLAFCEASGPCLIRSFLSSRSVMPSTSPLDTRF